MTKQLRLASDLALPLDAVTQTFLVVGKRGSGKSNTAARFVEQLHYAQLPFVVLDPVDTWWGLKAGRDGGRGLDVYVFGGRHQDLPLEPGGGALLAEVLCEHRIPMVLSVKHLSGRERSTFMIDFAKTLFQKWAGGPLHVVLEEAHELAPQSTQNAREGEQAMLGAFKRLWKLGRASGIGGTAVTQRPASLSKDITTQSEILIAHRTIGPQDVKAVGEWVKYHGERLDLLAELPTLPTGEAFVWAPEFPEGKPIGLQRTRILLRDTYDSASTPKVGEKRIEPKELEAVDLERLKTRMAATIEKAKADDPRELRKELARVRQELAQAQRVKPSNQQASATTVQKPVLTAADRALLERVADRLAEQSELLRRKWADAVEEGRRATLEACTRGWAEIIASRSGLTEELEKQLEAKGFQNVLDKLSAVATPAPAIKMPPSSEGSSGRVALRAATARPVARATVDGITNAEQRILDSVNWWHAAGVQEPTRHQVAFVARYTVNGHFNNLVGGLRTKGLVDYPGAGGVVLTDAGRGAVNALEQQPSRQELIERVEAVLRGEAQRRIFRAVVQAGRDLTRDELAAMTNYTVNGHFNNIVGSLRSLGAIEYPRQGGVRLAALFEAVA